MATAQPAARRRPGRRRVLTRFAQRLAPWLLLGGLQIGLLAATSTPAAVAATPVAGAAAERPTHPGRIVVLKLRRPGLHRPSQVWIYRPGVPDTAQLPVVYFLHGSPGKPADVFHAGLKRVLDRYIARGGAPFVVAAPDGNSSLHADTEWGDSSDGTDELETFLLTSVIPAVEGPNPRTPARRAIVGFSMGGYGAMNIGLRHPDQFAQIVSIAGYFMPDDPSQMFATPDSMLANSPVANVARARGKRILLLEDEADPLTLIRGQSLAFKGLLESTGIAATWHLAPGSHDLGYVIGQFPMVARYLDRGFA